MLVAAAVCPCPPLLVPAVAAGAAGELAEARGACAGALRALAEAAPDRLVVVGAAESGRAAGSYPAGSTGSFRGYGVDLDVTLGTGPGGDAPGLLPPALAVGAWLLDDAGWRAAPVAGLALDGTAAPDACAAAGAELAAAPGRLALLVMGDGSACRGVKAPGYLDPRAEDFDAAVTRALSTADPAALAALDPVLAAELHAAGRPGWQLLAGAAEGAGLTGRLRYAGAPYGVGYTVADWRRTDGDRPAGPRAAAAARP